MICEVVVGIQVANSKAGALSLCTQQASLIRRGWVTRPPIYGLETFTLAMSFYDTVVKEKLSGQKCDTSTTLVSHSHHLNLKHIF